MSAPRQLAIALGVCLALLAAAELAVRGVGIGPGPWPAAGPDAAAPHLRVDPLLGPRPKPGYSGPWVFAELDPFPVVIDERGFRSSGSGPAADGAKRVAFSGDSCTFGWQIPTGSTFVAQLEGRARREARPLELVNGAFPGESAVSGSYALRELLLPLRPALVVIGFSANNAFRWSTVGDAERFRWYALRKLALESRLVRLAGAWLARRGRAPLHPRDPEARRGLPLERWKRVAFPDEFEAALRRMVRESRASGAEVAFLLFPRASQVSRRWRFEDPAYAYGADPLPPRTAALTDAESALLGHSCLDPRALDDPIGALRERIAGWQPVFPADRPELLEVLRAGARAYREGERTRALTFFRAAAKLAQDSPLVHYDLGAALIDVGERDAGLRELERADALACSVFLQYQVVLRRVAVELGVPVVDLLLLFQARPAGPLFVDAAHPSPAAQRLIAEALWPLVARESS